MTGVTTVPTSLLPVSSHCLSHPTWKGGSFCLHLTKGQGTAPSSKARILAHKQTVGEGRDGLPGRAPSFESCQPEVEAKALSLKPATRPA